MVFEYIVPDKRTESLLELLLREEKVSFRSDKQDVPRLWKSLGALRDRKLVHMSCDERLHEQTLFLRSKPLRKKSKWGKPCYVWDHTFSPRVPSLDELLKK